MEGVKAPVEFDLLEVGVEGKFEVVPKSKSPPILPPKTLPAGLPPVLPSVTEELEDLFSHPEELPIHDLGCTQKFWSRKQEPRNLYAVDITPVQTTICVDRNSTTGELLGFKEEYKPDVGATAKNSMSLRRPPGPPEQSVRGSSTNCPFWPGGLDEPNLDKLSVTTETTVLDFQQDLLTCPPGFAEGMVFEEASSKADNAIKLATPGMLTLADIMAQADEIDFDEENEEEKDEVSAAPDKIKQGNPEAEGTNIDELVEDSVKKDEPVKLKTVARLPKEEWAIMIDVNNPVKDFHKRIPCMAKEWPFELDIFQKQAVLHLEAHDCVFVAAHTSAGKTVVAEYAIALSLQNRTRTIYTSPIKALSNQKFRDFKVTFEDVGLITGDVQIKPEASCLIMTTEILRSMLYNGSDVIRDLEWVIFDEVHYINDAERGVVWEEVLIMLPQHVNIILLSATVPNTMEFADWVGRIKKKRVYVVSTQKRPVPLEHYLYTGNSAKTSNELFLLMDSNKNFLTAGYNKALNAKKERASKSSQSFGPKTARGPGGIQQEKNIWLSVIEMLRKKDKLPVVAFTFSRRKIDENAATLTSVDLTTQSEKAKIHQFFEKCTGKLKGTDKDLPQVKNLREILKRGVGIHHSGVLPILKEVVEMLFHDGLVKILFATETFAMGVNMPARTVVFDSIRKHDGTNFRDLLPGEYIQMAGRAGRRGLDTTGTVIILCKGDVPEMADLHKMMLGKPTLLQSQFRLTYSMILNLLRVEELRVEDMMKKSFSEFHTQKDVDKRKERLKEIVQRMQDLPEVLDYSGDLELYYDACNEYWGLKHDLQKIVMTHPYAIRACSPGRVVIVDKAPYHNVLGVILQSSSGSKERKYQTLVICEQKQENMLLPNSDPVVNDTDDLDLTIPRPYSANQLFHPEGPCGQALVELVADNISLISTKTLKISADKIIDDIKKRKMPRFKNDPPGQSTSVATQELLRLTEANPDGLPGLDPVKDLNIRDIEVVEQFRRLHLLAEGFRNYQCVHDPSFKDNFRQLKKNRKVQEEYQQLKYLLSDESLQLLPEYQQRIDVLRGLGYIDKTNTVQLKGRVACEMSNHELIITELVFENVLTKLHPTDIAAVLSSVVFEQKKCSEPKLTPELETAKENFLKIAERIGLLQKECGLRIPVDDYLGSFHFGLMEVVFEWARGLPFSEIIQLTDVQEGIIVRTIQRLDEVLKDVRNAARIIGDEMLFKKMEEASTSVKRDIVFAASLYTQ